jgi:hypothetical protein
MKHGLEVDARKSISFLNETREAESVSGSL